MGSDSERDPLDKEPDHEEPDHEPDHEEPDHEEPDDEEPDHEEPDHEDPEESEAKHAANRIKNRHELRQKFRKDADLEAKEWESGQQDERYRLLLKQCLQDDRQCPSPPNTDDATDALNVLQLILERALHSDSPAKLDMAKTMVRLVIKIEREQEGDHPLSILCPTVKENPLSMAIEFDTKAKTDLTKYMCGILPREDAEKALAAKNNGNESYLHSAILKDLEGVEDLIIMAPQSVFRQVRNAKGIGDGNTPLHDALYYGNHVARFPDCKGTEAHVGRQAKLALSVLLKPNGDGDVGLHGPPLEIEPAPPKRVLTSLASSSQPSKPLDKVCSTCSKAAKAFESLKSRRAKIITELMKRDIEVLMVHNAAGQSPYLYYLATKEKYNTKAKKREPSSQNAAAAQPEADAPKRNTDGKVTKEAVNPKNIKKLKEPVSKFKEPAPKPKDTAPGIPKTQNTPVDVDSLGRRASTADSLTVSPAGGKSRSNTRKKIFKPVGPKPHKKDELREGELWPDLKDELKEQAFAMGGYDEAYKCLFLKQNDDEEPSTGEEGRLQSWSLEKKEHRVNETTREDFNFLRFEPILSTVTINLQEDDKDLTRMEDKHKLLRWNNTQKYLKRVFKWLTDAEAPNGGGKGVKEIIRLIVRDNPPDFCSDETVESCLSQLEVRYLDWNRPDLCAKTLQKVPDLVQLDLYWSGINAVLCSWSDEKGLGNLRKLRVINLHAQKGRESPTTMTEYVKQFKRDLAEWHENHKSAIRAGVHLKDGDESGNENRLRVDTKKGTSPGEKNQWFAIASSFAQHLRSRNVNDESLKVKVAVIDDGVNPTYNGVGGYLHWPGWPRRGSQAQDIITSTNQHGSKMAYLITSICPYVKIYVAKLGNPAGTTFRERAFSLKDATKAVKWAAGQDVDIISMSWNARLKEATKNDPGNANEVSELHAAITNAVTKKGILMYCAAGDNKGGTARGEKWVPCDLPSAISIGATDNNGTRKPYVVANKELAYLFPGENVLPDTDKDPDSKEVGNSGATAIAAGLAALVLFFTKWKNIKVEKVAVPRYMDKVMKSVFDANEKVVQVKGVLEEKLIDKFENNLRGQA